MFEAAEWTHPNGHPRCIICGDEETEDGKCPGLKAEPVRFGPGAGASTRKAWIAFTSDQPWLKFSTPPTAPWVELDRIAPFVKVDEEKRLVYMVVMEPGDPEHLDTQGDFTKADEIEEACHDFMNRYRLGKAGLGLQHERVIEGHIKESYIAPQDLEIGGKPVLKGSWVMVAYVAEEEVWKSVKSGELTGASIGGVGERVPG